MYADGRVKLPTVVVVNVMTLGRHWQELTPEEAISAVA